MKITQSAAHVVLVGATLVATTLAAQADAIKVCYDDGAGDPWFLKEGKGLAIILTEMAAAKAGVKVEISALPWKRCLGEVESGAMAGALAGSYKDERAKFANYPMAGDKPDASRRMYTDGYTLYRVKGNTVSWDGSKFVNMTGSIGAQRGYSIIDDLKKAGAKVDEGPATAKDNLKKLVAGQIQGLALSTLEGEVSTKAPEFAGKVEKVTPPLVEKPYFALFGKDFYSKNQKAVDGLWAAMATVRDSKEYKAKEVAAFKK